MAVLERYAVRVRGIVQGVGFRPFVYRLAARYALGGWVHNDGAGVLIEAEGRAVDLKAFVRALRMEAPLAAEITSVTVQKIARKGELTFCILQSAAGTRPTTLVCPDLAVCADCKRELLDAKNRRFGYAFTNCTNCGPRYSIIRALPYDRPMTTMTPFHMCALCRQEYEDPTDRRFHAQPNACALCGPSYHLYVDGKEAAGDALQGARRIILAGGIVAIKGIGGYHLACDARREESVAALRRRKRRIAKPLAVMAGSLETVRNICVVSLDEEHWLTSAAAPIVLLMQRGAAGGSAAHAPAPSVAPDNAYLGVMLPYAPVHHLLLAPEDLWVMTSANRRGEPMLYEDAAERTLSGLADAVLTHNRTIAHRVDDSVMRMAAGGQQILRRSRGFAPAPLSLPFPEGRAAVLAGGAELKNTFCLTRGAEAFLSEHIGDLTNAHVMAAYEQTVAHYERLFDVCPRLLAADLHPAYISGQYMAARAAREGLPLVRVQHHHAHIAAVLAEHGVREEVLGVAFDGTGYGADGLSWGGEFLAADLTGYRRLAHFSNLPLPGGDKAAKEPWRQALWVLHGIYGKELSHARPAFAAQLPKGWPLLLQAAEAGLSAPLTSSVGRLFDTAAALLGVRFVNRYEGEAAIRLEQLARGARRYAPAVLPYRCAGDVGGMTVDFLPVLRAMQDGAEQISEAECAARALAFHETLAAAVQEVLCVLSEKTGLRTVVLSGGVFQNALLLALTLRRLRDFRVLLPHRLPPNDGGIAYGQAAVALAQMK